MLLSECVRVGCHKNFDGVVVHFETPENKRSSINRSIMAKLAITIGIFPIAFYIW